MYSKAFKRTTKFLVMAALIFTSTNFCFAQTKKGIKVVASENTPTDNMVVTKTFEFDNGGVEIVPIEGDVDYTIYERSSKSGDWTKSDSGSLDAQSSRQVEVCKTSARAVKVEIKAKCDNCVRVRQIRCR